MNDQYGRPIFQGDTVTIKGTVIDILEDPNFVNCTVRLEQQMPPTGSQMSINLNTQMLTKDGPGQSQQPKPPTAGRLLAQRQAMEAATQQIHVHLAAVKQTLQRLLQQGG